MDKIADGGIMKLNTHQDALVTNISQLKGECEYTGGIFKRVLSAAFFQDKDMEFVFGKSPAGSNVLVVERIQYVAHHLLDEDIHRNLVAEKKAIDKNQAFADAHDLEMEEESVDARLNNAIRNYAAAFKHLADKYSAALGSVPTITKGENVDVRLIGLRKDSSLERTVGASDAIYYKWSDEEATLILRHSKLIEPPFLELGEERFLNSHEESSYLLAEIAGCS